MWVRSQDKKTLKNCNEFSVGSCNVYSDWNGNIQPYILGTYCAEERAIEVLDDIQRRVIKGYSKDYIINGTRIKNQFVYEMPQQ